MFRRERFRRRQIFREARMRLEHQLAISVLQDRETDLVAVRNLDFFAEAERAPKWERGLDRVDEVNRRRLVDFQL
jgi:hypothetical protein